MSASISREGEAFWGSFDSSASALSTRFDSMPSSTLLAVWMVDQGPDQGSTAEALRRILLSKEIGINYMNTYQIRHSKVNTRLRSEHRAHLLRPLSARFFDRAPECSENDSRYQVKRLRLQQASRASWEQPLGLIPHCSTGSDIPHIGWSHCKAASRKVQVKAPDPHLLTPTNNTKHAFPR